MRFSSASFIFGFVLAANTVSLTADDAITVKLSGEPGAYTIERWKKDWPGCEWEDGIMEGNASLVSNENNNQLRINYAVGQIGPEKCGVGWRWPFGKRDGAELRYTVRFSKDFDWVKGGKLPGLCGGRDNVSGGRPATGTNGFSARLMWRKDGRGEAYVYHKHQKGNYGDSFSFPDDFRFPMETPVHVRLAVTMNTPGQRNGIVRVWIAIGDENEKLMVERTDMEWRTVDTFGVDSLYFETFHGGGDASWAPTRECWAEFGEMCIKAEGGGKKMEKSAELDITQEYRKLYNMKATLEIPDDLYRRVKARSALEGRPLRSVAVQLFQNWLSDESPPSATLAAPLLTDHKPTRFDKAPWLVITKPYIKPEMSHDMEEIRAAIAKGWAEEMADKLNIASRKS